MSRTPPADRRPPARWRCSLAGSVLLALAACTGLAEREPATGRLAGEPFTAALDTPVARYYLEHYLSGRRGDPALDARIDALYRAAPAELPDRHALARIAEAFSTDFAALYFADRIAAESVNCRFKSLFLRELERARQDPPKRFGRTPAASHYELLFVPGYLYRRYPQTGADFAAARAALERAGFAQRLLETDEDAAVEANAARIMRAIAAGGARDRRLIVVSASKSGAEVALALARLPREETGRVAAWLNVVGTLAGTPLADDALTRGLARVSRALGDIDPAGVESLATARRRAPLDALRLPGHVLVVNYIGIPVSGTISERARPSYRRLRRHGPNDGLSLLADLLMPGGVTVAELGRDHYLVSEGMDARALALASTVIAWLEARPEAFPRVSGARCS